jgi:putative ABC transport system permease protein
MSALRSLLTPVILAARRIRSDLPLTAAVFGAVLVTSFVFTAAPRAFDSNADDGLRFAVSKASPFERNVEITRAGRIEPSGQDPIEAVSAAGTRLAQSFPESVRDVIRNGRDTVETTRYTAVDAPGVPGPPGTTRLLTLEYVQGAADRVRLVSGRMPEERDEIVPLPFRLGQPRAPLVEVAIPLAAANQLSLQAGDVLYLEPDFEDVLAGAVPLSERRMIAAEVTGIFSPKRDADAAWLDDARLGAAVTRDTDQRRYVYGFGLFAPAAYGEVADASAPLPLRYSWRYDVDASGFDAGTIDRLDSDVRKLDASFGESTFGQRLGTGVRTGLSEVLTDYRADRDAAAAVIAIDAVGLLALALAVVALLGGLAANRRRESIALVRSRGGASWQVLGAEAVEGIAVALPAGLAGYVLALVLVDGRSVVTPVLLVLGIVLATGGILAAAASGAARSGLTARRGREEVAVTSVSPGRLAIEAAVVVSSLVGVYLLRRRGLADANGFDPYLAAVPLLLGLAAGIVAVRLYPLPVRFLAAAAARRRDLVPALALRRVARQPGVTAAPLLVLLLGVSVSVFAAVMAATVSHAQEGAGSTALSPLATGTLDAFRAGAVLGAAYAAFVIVLALLLTARTRLRDLAYLRALGLSRRQAVAVTAAELAPPFVVALVVGTALGLATAYLVEPGLDLTALAAGGRDVALRLDPVGPLLLAVVLLAVSAAAVWATAAVVRRMSLSRSLRMGER